MSQTTYNLNLTEAFQGMLVDSRNSTIESAVADETIQFGYAVVTGATAPTTLNPTGSVKLPASAGEAFRGFAVHRQVQHAYPYSGTSAAYAANDVVDVLRKGTIWARALTAMTIDSDVFISYGTAGQVRSDNTSGLTAAVGKCRRACAADGICLVEINLP